MPWFQSIAFFLLQGAFHRLSQDGSQCAFRLLTCDLVLAVAACEGKKRERDKGKRGLTTCWTRTRTVEVASRDWRRGCGTHFRGVCTDMWQLQLLHFPLLSSRIIWKFRCDVGTLYFEVCRDQRARVSEPQLIFCSLPADWLQALRCVQ